MVQRGTETQQKANSVVDGERSFRLLVERVIDYAIFMLDPTGIITNWNAGAERIKGYSAQEAVGCSFAMFYTAEDQAAGMPMRALETARRNGNFTAEGWRVRKDGSRFWASVAIDAIRDDDGTLVGFAKITRDSTERREAQLALERVQHQLAESQKMDALGQLTGGVAHDFNNLLMVVSGHVETLRRLGSLDGRAARAIEAITQAVHRGARLTDQLLTFSRRAPVNPRPIDLRELIFSIREVLTSGLGGDIALTFDVPSDIWPVTVDIGELENTLINVVINSRDAMPDGGTVSVAADNVALDEKPVPPGDYVAITVTDSGIGIPADVLSRVFDPFFTTKPVGKGTGLGLSQVHGFVHQAGGTVKIDSTLGKGTRLTIFLPRSTELPAAAESEQSQREASTAGTVLLVEDNPDVASASSGFLEQLGYAVRWVPDADAALSELEHDDIDLVFSDIVMPGRIDGLALARIVRSARPDLPILLATGYSEAAQNARTDFPILRKPYRMRDLSQALAGLKRG